MQQTIERHRGEPSYRPIVVVEDATLAQVAAITADGSTSSCPTSVVEQVPTRKYPADALAAHLFGYVGQANEAQLGDGIVQGAIVGQSGRRAVYNKILMGEDGAGASSSTASAARSARSKRSSRPKGAGVQLTIDYDLQKAAEDGFRARRASTARR